LTAETTVLPWTSVKLCRSAAALLLILYRYRGYQMRAIVTGVPW
jgi:hypothetical protein